MYKRTKKAKRAENAILISVVLFIIIVVLVRLLNLPSWVPYTAWGIMIYFGYRFIRLFMTGEYSQEVMDTVILIQMAKLTEKIENEQGPITIHKVNNLLDEAKEEYKKIPFWKFQYKKAAKGLIGTLLMIRHYIENDLELPRKKKDIDLEKSPK